MGLTLNAQLWIQWNTFKGVKTNSNQIIPVALFLDTCFTYQDDKTKNLLIRVLDTFNLGITVDDDTFMNTFGEFEKQKNILFQSGMKWLHIDVLQC